MAIPIGDRFNLWSRGQAPFLFLEGRVFTLVAVGYSNKHRVLENDCDGDLLHIGDYVTTAHGWGVQFMKDANLTNEELTAHFVTERITRTP